MSELPKVAGQSVPGQPGDLARLEACSPGTESGACVFPEPRTRPYEMDAASISQSNRRAGEECPPEWWDLSEAPGRRLSRTVRGHRCDSQRVPSRDHEEETQPMALSQSALSELLDAIRAGGSVDVMREAMTFVLQELIELEAGQAIGADRCERTDERTIHRNGSRGRLLSTKAGDVELRIPKFRAARSSRRSSSRGGGSTGPSGRSSWRPTSTAFPGARSTISWPPWASMPGSARARSRGSAPSSTRSWRPSATARWLTRSSRTCSSTRRTSRPTRVPRSCPRRSSSPRG
jgi:hypothetical protein